jgi:spermidine synthase
MSESKNTLTAYSINILGSILGTWLFVGLSYFYLPPAAWFLASAVILGIFIYWSTENKRVNFALLALAVIISIPAGYTSNSIKSVWSPYQKLVVRTPNEQESGAYVIDVNNVGYQIMIDLSPQNIEEHPELFSPDQYGLSQYDIPLKLHPDPKSFLVIGAGSGNDVAGAIRQGVDSITGVEIDPAIIELGREFHPEHPYSNPNVKIVNDDARSFFATTSETYDVISFGLLDSHTTTAMTNARLDHYVYTLESIKQAKSLLNKGGIITLTFEARKPYIIDRMNTALTNVFGYRPMITRIPSNPYGWGGVMFITGDMESVNQQINKNIQLKTLLEKWQREFPISVNQKTKVITDDWPYVYLEKPSIPSLYFLLVILMAVVFVRSYKKWDATSKVLKLSRSFWHFFFLGAAFLLLEVQNISKASVVLGNTWQVNVIIISSILIMALLANLLAYKFLKLPITAVYGALIAITLALYFVDLARFAFLPYMVKALVVGGLSSLPMLFSGMAFIRSFTQVEEKDSALGANLIGALIGAMLQSVTFITGIKALLLIVAGFYLASFFTRNNKS